MRISGHYSNDDHRHWYFVRDSKIPHGEFGVPFRERMAELAALVIFGVIVGMVAIWVHVTYF